VSRVMRSMWAGPVDLRKRRTPQRRASMRAARPGRREHERAAGMVRRRPWSHGILENWPRSA